MFFPILPQTQNRYGQGNCPDCGYLLPQRATSCPTCSQETSTTRPLASIIVVVVVAILFSFYAVWN